MCETIKQTLCGDGFWSLMLQWHDKKQGWTDNSGTDGFLCTAAWDRLHDYMGNKFALVSSSKDSNLKMRKNQRGKLRMLDVLWI